MPKLATNYLNNTGVTNMSMTKKDYELVADAIYLCKVTGTDLDALREVASAIASKFESDNNKFDRKKFLTACGLEQDN